MLGRALLTAALVATAGCAVRPAASAPPVSPPVAAVDLDGLLAAGCYRCLERAYDRVAASSEAQFQVAVLLALRSKELGLPFEAWLDAATSRTPAGPEWPTYLEVARAVRIDPLSGDREAIMRATQAQRRPAAVVQEWRTQLRTGAASALFRSYLDLTLACSLGEEARKEASAAAAMQYGAVPLIRYRLATCASPSHLLALRDEANDFPDIELPLGRNALDAAQSDQEEALRRFRSAADAFPQSPVIAASMGAVHQDREEWPEALAAYEAALQLVPTHRDALLGRAVALSNLSRHHDAIASASRLLELGDWFIGAAYFWRAWNRYHLGDMAAARDDLDLAAARGAGAATLVLSGLVAWRQQQLEYAETEFARALNVDAGQCEASAFLAAVQTSRKKWEEAVASFQHTQQCFDLSIALRRTLIADVLAGPGTPDGKAAQVARHERAIAEAQGHRDDARENEVKARARLP
jgi:tetratricopeptide (TPR) repeat protein